MTAYAPAKGHWGLDYSGARPAPVVMRSMGVRFVCRYLCYVNGLTRWKIVTLDEALALGAEGIGLVLNWEWYASRMIDPNVADKYQAGRADAKEAVAQARALGAPLKSVIIFSCDTGITEANVPDMLSYMRGVEEIVEAAGFEVDLYGGRLHILRWIEDRLSRGKGPKLPWQSFAWSTVNGRIVLTPYTAIFQHLGHPHFDSSLIGGPSATDENEVVAVGLTQRIWVPGTDFGAPGPDPIPDPGQPTPGLDYDMPLVFNASDSADIYVLTGSRKENVSPAAYAVLAAFGFTTHEVTPDTVAGIPDMPGTPKYTWQQWYLTEIEPFITATVQAAVKASVPAPAPVGPVDLKPGQVVKVDPAQTVTVDVKAIAAATTASTVAALKLSGIPAVVDEAQMQAVVEASIVEAFTKATITETTTEKLGFTFG